MTQTVCKWNGRIGIIPYAEKYDKEWLKSLIELAERNGYAVYPVIGEWKGEE